MRLRRLVHAVRRQRRLVGAAALVVLVPAAALVAARALGLVGVSWALVLTPFTASGAVAAVLLVAWTLEPGMRRATGMFAGWIPFRRGPTPPPDRLEPPMEVEASDARLLTEHPEILAAVCHGLRKGRLVPSVMGRPTTDPWGLYHEAVVAGDDGLEALRTAAARHTRRFRDRGRSATGRNPSDSTVLKQAVRTFEQCARKAQAGHNSPECTFEHLTVIYGIDVPSRNRRLEEAAPRVRRLLELMYPDLDVTPVGAKESERARELRREAVRAQREAGRLEKEAKRLKGALAEADEALEAERADVRSLRASLESHRQRAQAEAEAMREAARREAEAAVEEEMAEQALRVQRLEDDKRRVEEALEETSKQRDAFERALFEDDEEEGADAEGLHPFPVEQLAGTRILLVGGLDRQVPPVREHLESFGVQVLHEDSPAAAGMVDTVHVVVLWTRFLSHAIAGAVKRECRVRELPFLYWTRASPPSLVRLLAEAEEGAGARAGDAGEG